MPSTLCCQCAQRHDMLHAGCTGLTAALVDETLGALVYILKREGIIGDGPSFTVRLEMDYKKPVPASTIVCCTAELQSAEGRKAWVKARVQVTPPLGDSTEHAVDVSHGQMLSVCGCCRLLSALW